MTNVSKQPLAEEDYQQLAAQFSTTLARLTPTISSGFIDDLLGPEEKIMLMKRLAAIVMYAEGHSSYRVWQTLNLSPSTAQTIQQKFEANQYDHIRQLFVKHKTDYKKLLTIIEVIARGGLPPLAGPGRWGNLSPMRDTRNSKK